MYSRFYYPALLKNANEDDNGNRRFLRSLFSILGGLRVGGVLGGASGALIGSLVPNSGSGAAIGGAIGALLGGAGGAYLGYKKGRLPYDQFQRDLIGRILGISGVSLPFTLSSAALGGLTARALGGEPLPAALGTALLGELIGTGIGYKYL